MYSWWWVGLSPETCRVKAFAKNKPQLLHLVGIIFTTLLQCYTSGNKNLIKSRTPRITGAWSPTFCRFLPHHLSIIIAISSPYTQKCVSVHMHRAQSTKQHWGSEVTAELWILSEGCFISLLARKICGWFLDFWQICGPLLNSTVDATLQP